MIKDYTGRDIVYYDNIDRMRQYDMSVKTIRRWTIFYSQYCIIVFNAYGNFEMIIEKSDNARRITNSILELPKSIAEAVKYVVRHLWDIEILISPNWSYGGLSERTYGVEIEALFPSRYTRESMCRHLTNLGVEVICTGYNHDNSYTTWKMTTDASIRADRPGYNTCEIVSPILRGDEGLRKINELCRVLDDSGFIVNKTCGFHVHHDVRDMDDRQRLNIIDFYRVNETIFDSICSRSRRGNNNAFCQSLRGFSPRHIPSSRYVKVNGQSYSRHGTVEFRQHQGTVDYQKIANWVRLTQHVVELAATKKRTYASLADMLTALELTDYIVYYEGRQQELGQ